MTEQRKRDERIWRRCPRCGIVRPASDYKRATGKPDWGPERPTRCPTCEHVGRYQTFSRAEAPAGAEH